METTTSKCWPHVTHKDAEYVASLVDAKECRHYDIYNEENVRRFSVHYGEGKNDCTYYSYDVLDSTHIDWIAHVAPLMNAHRARTPAPSAPAAMSITREQLEAMARKRYESLAHPHAWDRLNDKGRRKQIEALTNALAEGGITVAPPPPPQKSEGEKIAEQSVTIRGRSVVLQSQSREYVIPFASSSTTECNVEIIREWFAERVDAALDARDEEHRQRFMDAMGKKDWDMRADSFDTGCRG